MAMIHHDSRGYETAVSESARKFQVKLEERIHGSLQRVTGVLEEVAKSVPADAIVRGNKLRFEHSAERGIVVYKPQSTAAVEIHPHAMNQIAGRTDIERFYTVINDLRTKGAWGYELAARMLNDVYTHMSDKQRFLTREIAGRLYGFLSDEYRRLDTRPIMDSFLGAIQKYGARPLDGFALTTKDTLRAILPYVFEPCPGEVLAYGVEFSNSNFGDGFLRVASWFSRVYCTNDASLEDVLKQVHLGKRLPDNIQFSEQTYKLDTAAMSHAVGDIVGSILSPNAVNSFLDVIRKANEERVESSAIAAWAKKNLNKEEAKKAIDMFSSADIETLPAGQTQWRWSNALSWLARETDNEHRKLELQEFAGDATLMKKRAA